MIIFISHIFFITQLIAFDTTCGMNTKLIRFTFGQEIVCELTSETDESITIKNSLAGVMTNQGSMAFVPFIPLMDKGEGAVFLIDSGMPGETEPMVNIFLDKCKQEGFRNMLKNQFVKYNDACIDSFVKGDFKGFCAKIAEHFPQKVRNIIDQSDFSNAYLWKTKDFNLLPYFGKHNIVLVGDAAHLTLPFTSSGVNFAITDALLLVDLLEKHNDFKLLNKDYYEQRAEEVAKTIELGRILKNQFLNNDDGIKF